MSKPAWLAEARQRCRDAKIEIVGWGDEALVVSAQSPELRSKAVSTLGDLGFHAVEDADDDYAGLLTLKRIR